MPWQQGVCTSDICSAKICYPFCIDLLWCCHMQVVCQGLLEVVDLRAEIPLLYAVAVELVSVVTWTRKFSGSGNGGWELLNSQGTVQKLFPGTPNFLPRLPALTLVPSEMWRCDCRQ